MDKTLLEDDLDCMYDDFGIVCQHSNDGLTEEFRVLFDEESEVVLQNGEYEGMSTLVPSFVVSTHKSGDISSNSTFVIDGKKFEYANKNKRKDGTTIVYLGRL